VAKPISFGNVGVDLRVGTAGAREEMSPNLPMCIALLGDWSRRGSSRPVAERVPVEVDRDNIDEVVARFGVTIDAGIGSPVRFAAIEDFHPDRIVRRVEVFQALRGLRARLSNPSTFNAAAGEMRAWTASAAGQPTAQQEPVEPPPPSDPHALLEQIVGGELPPTAAPNPFPGGTEDLDSYVRRIVAPSLLPRINYSQQEQLLAVVDDAVSRQMRAILHHPEVQGAEAAWRGVFFLVRRLATDADLKLYLLDVSKDELAADLASADDLRSTASYRLLVDRAADRPWGIVAGNYTFDAGRADVETLGRLARIAGQAGAPFLAAASPRVLGCALLGETPDADDWQPVREDEEAWASLRGLPEAVYLGLALPRFLLRLPYGKTSDPIEEFAFEEMEGEPRHESYLWGNPAFACTYLLAQAFSRYGWDFHPGVIDEIDGLPTHVFEEGGGTEMKPCAEAWLTTRAADAILARGLIPLLSMKGQDVVRAADVRSVAAPERSLAGRWRT
jgi:type VI secretion system protein ImpC